MGPHRGESTLNYRTQYTHRTQDTDGTNNPLKKYTPGQDTFSTIVVQPWSRKHLAKTYL